MTLRRSAPRGRGFASAAQPPCHCFVPIGPGRCPGCPIRRGLAKNHHVL